MKLKHIVASLLTSSGVGGIVSFFSGNRIHFRGVVIDTGIPEISAVTKAQLFWKIYESAEIRFIQKYLPESGDVIELGSSIGVVSSIIRRRLSADSRLICVEAHPALSRHSSVNLALNSLSHNVTSLNKAINYNRESGAGVYFTPGQLTTTGRLTCGNPLPNSILVESTTLSDLKQVFRISNFTLVADIEGAEVAIIREDKHALDDCQHIFLELHDTTYSGVAVSVEEMIVELTNVHGFFLKDRYDNVVYLNRRGGGGDVVTRGTCVQ